MSEPRTAETQLFALYKAFWDDMQNFHISPIFDAKASYTTRMRDELNAIKGKYTAAIEHELLRKTIGV